MAERKELVIKDFTEVTESLVKALDQINTIYTSSFLSDEEKSELGRLGRSIYEMSHELDHLFLDLKSVSDELKKQLRAYYAH